MPQYPQTALDIQNELGGIEPDPINYKVSAQLMPQEDLKVMALQVAEHYGIPRDLFLGKIRQESGWNPAAVGTSREYGLNQIMPETGRRLGMNITNDDYDDRWHPGKAMDAAARLLIQEYQNNGNDWKAALRAYNTGKGAPSTKGDQYVNAVISQADKEIQEFDPNLKPKPEPGWADEIKAAADYWKDNAKYAWGDSNKLLYNTMGNFPMLLNKLREVGGAGYGIPPEFPQIEGVEPPPNVFAEMEQDLRGLAETTGPPPEPIEPSLKAPAADWLFYGGQPKRRKDLGSQVIQGLVSAPMQVALYAGPVKYWGPVIGFGATDAFKTIEKGIFPAIEAGIKGMVLGAGFKGMEPLTHHQQIVGLGALGALGTAIDGGGPREITAGAMTMMALGAMGRGGSKTAKQMVQDAWEQFKPKFEMAKERAAIIQGDNPPPIMEPPKINENKLVPSVTEMPLQTPETPPGEIKPTKMYSGGPETAETLKRGVEGFINKYKEIHAEPTQPELIQWEKAKTDWQGEINFRGFQNYLESVKQKEIIRQFVGERIYGGKSKELAQALWLYIDSRRNPSHVDKYYNDLPPEIQKAIDRFPEIESDPVLRDLVDRIKGREDAIGKRALDEGVIKNLLENHQNRIYEPKEEQLAPPSQERTKFITKTRHRLERKYETVLEAIVEGGKKPLITDVADNQLILGDELSKVIADKQLLAQNPNLFGRGREGMSRIEHPNFRRWDLYGNINLEPIMKEAKFFNAESKKILKEGVKPSEGYKAREDKIRDLMEMRGFNSDKVDNYIDRMKSEEPKKEIFKDLESEIKTLIEVAKVRGDERTGGQFLRRDLVIDNETGDVLKRNELFAPKKIARELNNILGKSELQWKPAQIATKYNAAWKASVLSYSLFHPQAFLRNLITNPIRFWNVFSPVDYYKEGWASIYEMGPNLEMLYRQGLKPFRGAVDWQEMGQEKTIFGQLMDKNFITKGINDLIWKGVQLNVDFTFKNMGNAFKAQYALDSLKWAAEKNPGIPLEKVAKQVADYSNNVWGGLNEPLRGTNPVAMHIERLALLARDWTRSNLNLFIDAFGPDVKGELSRRYWLLALGKTFAATSILNMVMSFGDDLNMWERFRIAWEAGKFRWLDADITPLYRFACELRGKNPDDIRYYFRVGGHFFDALKMIFTPVAFIHDKSSILARMVEEAGSGHDWRGNVFTTIAELSGATGREDMVPLRAQLTKEPMKGQGGPITPEQYPSYALHQVRQILPIPMQNLLASLTGEMDGFEAVIKSTGTRVTATRPKSDAQKAITEIIKTQSPVGTPLEQEQKKANYKLFNETILNNKNPAKFETEWTAMVDRGERTQRQYDNAIQHAEMVLEDSRYGQMKWQFKNIQNFGGALRVFELANPQERQALSQLMEEKWMRVKPEDVDKYEKKMDQLLGATQ